MISKRENIVYVSGRRDSCADSVCSAIALADLKNKMAERERMEAAKGAEKRIIFSADYGMTAPEDASYMAVRSGISDMETLYILDRYRIPEPMLLEDARTQVKDIDISRAQAVSSDISLKQAWMIMRNVNKSTLAAADSEGRLEGIITTGDIAKSYMSVFDNEILGKAQTSIKNIIDALEGEMICGDPEGHLSGGKVMIAAANTALMADHTDPGDVVILGNRYEAQLCAIEQKAAILIICDGVPVSRTIKKMADQNNVCIISTSYGTYAAARVINQSMPIEYFMTRNPISFCEEDYIDDIRGVMTSERTRDFPVTDKEGLYAGMISRRNLIDMDNKKFILVDHNEKELAIDGIDSAEVIEIVDHHKLGTIETVKPVIMRNQPAGSTSAIIWQMYQEQMIDMDEKAAGLLCGGILSATKGLNDDLSTDLDRCAFESMSKKAGIDAETFYHDMKGERQ